MIASQLALGAFIVSPLLQDIDVIVTYSDASGAIRAGRVKMSQLSPSWIIESPNDRNRDMPNDSQVNC